MQAADSPAAARKALFVVFLVVVIDLLGFGIVLPLLPQYAKAFLGDEQSARTGIVIGVLFAIFSLMQFVFAPVWGALSDRIGRRPVLLVGLAGSVLFYALFGFGSDLDSQPGLALAILFFSRAGAGIAGATIATAQAAIADCTTAANRSKGMALIGMAFGIGFCVGPLLGAATVWATPSLGAPCYLAAGLSFVALVLAWRILPETLAFGTGEGRHRGFSLGAVRRALAHPAVGVLIVAFFFATFGFANFEATLALLSRESFGFTEATTYLLFAYVGFSLALAQGGIYRRLAHKVPERRFLVVGVGLMLLGLANLAAITALAAGERSETLGAAVRSPLFWWFLAALFVAVCGFAFVNPSVQSLISRHTDAAQQGEVLGANQSAGALARILGPVVGLGLFNSTANHMLPYLTASLLLGVVLLLVPRVKQL